MSYVVLGSGLDSGQDDTVHGENGVTNVKQLALTDFVTRSDELEAAHEDEAATKRNALASRTPFV